MNTSLEFFTWLANQSAFVEVMIGAFFCLVIAPIMLAGIATVVTQLEGLVEKRLSAPVHMAPAVVRGNASWLSAVVEGVGRLTGLRASNQ